MNRSTAPPALPIAEYDFDLPPDLIAQTPLAERDASRLLVLDRDSGAISHQAIRDLPGCLRPGDLIVANNSRVIPARLRAVKERTGGAVELLLLRRDDNGVWEALAKPSRRLRRGDRLLVRSRRTPDDPGATIDVRRVGDEGRIEIVFARAADERLDEYGEAPLPPYIRTALEDPERYQTTYATVPGSAAAPTAGLHVTPALRDALSDRGVGWAEVTLHVGLDTFRPIASADARDHRIHREWCAVDDAVAERIARCKAEGGRVIAVGTTSARTLETLGAVWRPSDPRGWSGLTDEFILPGHRWRIVDGLLTNFHLPRSSLLLLVGALAGWDRVRAAYREAIERRYRFFSFGDAMLIVPERR
ncbi:MAG: S-adenosylmethionine:tRNA ribosyltransferase-isomerase [uncultured Thermomicrobiales bacterium]|uniref:S-adenosylmethionine:tRNA ribosyltransferase-isomerase n=1 Tax=uncultured Thermomicrobiales bacterium TaxID=1645740 RepID=A0A6J4UF69_9BACT|nr:MAG: S-adenosylmethionine:tRNA ribosyltransferase-isomerase [uncultured Thermomicrobiales bacterium]